jgi:signal transduction histidine kinase/CheY-like chemotaxis protein/HPt (histidine-containing phosphotransfer) domain-containing protein
VSPPPSLPVAIPLGQRLARINQRILASVLAIFALIVIVSSFVIGILALLESTQSRAAILAENLSASLLFSNADDAGELLKSLGHAGDVKLAAVYNERQQLFAQHSAAGIGIPLTPPATQGIDYSLTHVAVVHPIRHKEQLLGRLYLQVGLGSLYWQLLMHLLITASAAVLALLLGHRLSNRLSRAALQPLAELSALMEQVSEAGDFEVRAKPSKIRELDTLAHGFNTMLQEIRSRDDSLREHRDHLETLLQERTAAMEQAREASGAKSRFLANMSHEIRTPLNAVIGLTGLLRRSVLDDGQRDRLRKIEDASQHLLLIINDILDLSKIEAGRLQLEEIDFSLDDLLGQVRSLVAESAARKGLVLRVERGDVPTWLRGDETRLRQGLLNFAANAVKFTERGSIMLRARQLADDGEALRVRFEVEDSGIGIAPDRVDRLFKAFEQADASTTRKYGGTGLGLAITRRLAQLMGGDAGLSSEPGKGSTFWFTARLRHGEPPASEPKAPAMLPEPAELARCCAGARILLAEDNQINCEVVLETLKAAGLEADVAVNGREAVEKAQTGRYHLVLMDMQMPVLDGIEATRQIRELPNGRHLPIIAMTANAFADDRERCLAAGMNAFLAKPFDPDRLYELLRQWLPQTNPGRQVAAPVAAPVAGEDLARQLAAIDGLDLPSGLTTCRNKPEFLARLLVTFVQHHGNDPAALRLLACRGERSELERLAHALKSAAGNVGARQVSGLANDLLAAARRPEVADADLEGLTQPLADALERFVTSVRKNRAIG